MRTSLMPVTCILAFLVGCSTTTQKNVDTAVVAVEQNIPTIVTGLTQLGLNQWAKNNPDEAKLWAKTISLNVKTVVLPYFQTGTIPMVQAAQNVIKAVGGSNLPAGSSMLIVGVVGALQSIIAVPAPDGYMTEQQRQDVIAGLTALSAACDKFSK